MSRTSDVTEKLYPFANERYAEWGVDVDGALEVLRQIPVSLHCWQGDDVGGFEGSGAAIGGGLAVTGAYPGKARTVEELRADLERTYSLLPGTHRLNLHASYGEFDGKKVDRNEIEPSHFEGWIEWAKSNKLGLDFNPTYFAHPLAADGFTLAHPDREIRDFWIEHGKRTRKIASAIGRALGSPCVNNFWIPDGMKDTPADRAEPRIRLAEALDELFQEELNPAFMKDAVESKLFGLGSESYVVGSHEFYLGYAITRHKMLCLDAGHFHPTETISDKISAVMPFVPELLLHVSRGVRWDSDHVVTWTDELQAIARELVRGEYLSRTCIGLDFFDASINRVAAWVIGTRNLLKSLLVALLEPADRLQEAETAGDYTTRLALMEEAKSLPWGVVWDHYCLTNDVPAGMDWMPEVRRYEDEVLSKRS